MIRRVRRPIRLAIRCATELNPDATGAADLMRDLDSDPEYQALLAKKHKQHQEDLEAFGRKASLIVEELNKVGVRSVDFEKCLTWMHQSTGSRRRFWLGTSPTLPTTVTSTYSQRIRSP